MSSRGVRAACRRARLPDHAVHAAGRPGEHGEAVQQAQLLKGEVCRDVVHAPALAQRRMPPLAGVQALQQVGDREPLGPDRLPGPVLVGVLHLCLLEGSPSDDGRGCLDQ